MENPMSKQGNAGEYIWLRYTTEFSSGGRTHTVEIAVPMPIGASEEERERLLQEADAGMDQLTRHIEQRVARMQQRPAQAAQPPSKVSVPNAASVASTEPPPAQSKPSEPVAVPIQQTTPPTQVRETAAPQASTPVVAARTVSPKEEIVVPPTRPSISATMPSAPVKSNDVGGIMHIADFVKYIRDHMGLDPRQAMKLLNVKTFEGLNFRDAIERLKRRLAQEDGQASQQQSSTASSPPAAQPPREARSAPVSPTPPPETKPQISNKPTQSPAGATPAAQQVTTQQAAAQPVTTQQATVQQSTPQKPVVNQEPIILSAKRPANAFEEEIEPGDEEELEELEDDFDDASHSPELSRQHHERAQIMLDKLRATQGAATAGPTRLKALNNAVSSQISSKQLQELINGIWGTKTLNKLKADQVDELLSWAKTADYFYKEVEAVLELLEEEHYARGNR